MDNARFEWSESWFALRVKPRSEMAVSRAIREKGYQEFLPCYRVRRRWSDRIKSVEVPLFPSYVFCRLNPQRRLALLTIPGALQFAGIGRTPAPIDTEEIVAIQRAVESGLTTEPWPYLTSGQKVRLDRGPLAGLKGICLTDSEPGRLVVSVTLLQRSVAVSVDPSWAAPLGPRLPLFPRNPRIAAAPAAPAAR